MNQKQVRKKTRKIVIGHYAKMMSEVRHVAKNYAVERVPLKFINEIITLSRLNNKFDVPEMETFRLSFNDTLDLLKSECLKISKPIGDNCVSVNQFKAFIDALKTGFLQGQETSKEEI